jgi:hypothetical protein
MEDQVGETWMTRWMKHGRRGGQNMEDEAFETWNIRLVKYGTPGG